MCRFAISTGGLIAMLAAAGCGARPDSPARPASESSPRASQQPSPRVDAPSNAGAPRPHIILIVADDVGYYDVGYNGSRIRTPRIDELAALGVRLETYYTEPLCTPARAAILTGRYPLRYGLHAGNVRPWARHGLPPEERTLAEALRDAGYATSIVGKWHLGYARRSLLPRSQGFDRQYGCYQGSIDYYEHTHGNFGGLDWHRDGKPLREVGYATDLIADEAIRQITNHDPDVPLFLYLAFTAAHGPYAAPEECARGYDFLADAEHRAYAGVLTCLDRAVGRVVDALDRSALADNALLVFCADNGSGFESTAPGADTRHGKGTMYEGALRVPALLRWRGRLEGGRSVAAPVHAVDWYPTLVHLAGGSLAQPLPVDGADLWPMLAQGEPLERDSLLLSYDGTQGALRRGDWKLVSRTLGKMRTTELYDVAHDISERNDVADAHAELVAELTRAFDRFAAAAAEPLYERKPESFVPPKIWQPIEP